MKGFEADRQGEGARRDEWHMDENGGRRALWRVDNPGWAAMTIDHAKGISGARESATSGLYCVTAPGIGQSTTAWVVNVDDGDTGANVEMRRRRPIQQRRMHLERV